MDSCESRWMGTIDCSHCNLNLGNRTLYRSRFGVADEPLRAL